MTSSKKPPSPRRWHEQRWLTDVVVRAENIDWDQPRSGQTIGPIGSEATLEVNWAKARIRQYDDIAPAVIAAAERRERMAEEATRKELVVAQHGDRFLARGFAVLSVDGPGRGEAPLLGSYATEKNWIEAGEVFMQFLLSRPEVDPERIVAFGSSFGSFWMTQVAATQPRLKAVATALCCHEPGCYTIFEEASPSYKKRFMWMSDIEDEDEFDRMAAQMDLRPLVPGMKMPWLNIVGEKDELSPVHHTLELAARAGGPSPILMYQGERHALSGASSIVLGPKYMSYAADWLLDRVNGKPAEEVLDLVLADGRIERRPHPRQS